MHAWRCSGRRGRLLAGLALAEQILAAQAWANIQAGGGSRILGTNFIVELVTVMTSVWVPAILLGTLVAVIAGVSFGYLRMGPGMSKLLFAVTLGGAGLSGLMSMMGFDTAVALIW